MTQRQRAKWSTGARAMIVGLVASASMAQAQTSPPETPAAAAPTASSPSLDMTVNLIRLMVKRKLLSEAEAQELFAQAEVATRQAQQLAAAQAARTPPVAPPPGDGVQRVPYVSPSVRAAIRDEIKTEVLAQAKSEGWADPGLIKDWMRHVTVSGDFRFRSQSDFFDKGNVPGAVLDVATFNGTGPFDINLATNPTAFPTYNSNANRTARLLLRARLAVNADVTDAIRVGFRLASGNSDSPVSTNNLLGNSFTKKGIWLDRAYFDLRPSDGATMTFGRFQNPFDTTEMLFDSDLNFEGGAISVEDNALIGDGTGLKLVGGFFPLEFTSANFPANSDTKVRDRNKWLVAGQLIGSFKFDERLSGKLSGGYFSFKNVQGAQSTACATYLLARQCSTDQTRPVFSQKGNTVFPIRLIAQNNADPNFVVTPIPQYLGLVFDYDLIYFKGDLSFDASSKYRVSLQGDYVRNRTFRTRDACRFGAGASPFTGVVLGTTAGGLSLSDLCAPVAPGDTALRLVAGNTGWQVRAMVGTRAIEKFGDWSFAAGYRYLESDAVLDGFTDSDFALGGTNAKGYYLVGTLGLGKGINAQTRLLSSREITGPAYAVDVLFVDLNFGF